MPHPDVPTVWIVDDADSVRDSLRALLDTAGFTVSDYPHARAFLEAWKPGTAGCLILDHHMPGMTGLELLQQLAQSKTTPPTIVVTALSDPDLKQRLLAAGARHVLDKPADGDALIGTIESMLVRAA